MWNSINGYVVERLPRGMAWFGVYDVRTGTLVHIARNKADALALAASL